jgi:hypothetical protein
MRALYPHKSKRKKNICAQTSRLEKPEELQVHQSHMKLLFLTVLFLSEHFTFGVS